ncbi:MAG: N-6 DNA methylase [Candidatus Competibacter sp.]
MEYLKRVLLCAAPLNNPRDVAWFLASYARDARARLEEKPDLPALAALRAALENALGLRFEAENGEHFFRSTLIQTLFYGVFSAWVLWHREHPERRDRFDWKLASWTLRVPMIRALFEQLSQPSRLLPLGLAEVLDWVNGVLNRVDRAAFFGQFAAAGAVQYFYEPFLQAFDPELRKQLGVWYTPPEIVRYMVTRVDAVLREELDIADGLADPQVFILDPCCGTGAYLTEVLRHIKARLDEQGLGGLAGAKLKQAALERVFGFELLPAPYVVAHLQLGLLLHQWGATLQLDAATGQTERLGVYLTNALTGWQPPDEDGKKRMAQLALNFPELMAENDAARAGEAGAADSGDSGQSTVQRFRRGGGGRGAGIDPRLPSDPPRAAAAGSGLERSVRAILPDGGTAHRRTQRTRSDLLHLELFVVGWAVVHRNAGTVFGEVRPDLD